MMIFEISMTPSIFYFFFFVESESIISICEHLLKNLDDSGEDGNTTTVLRSLLSEELLSDHRCSGTTISFFRIHLQMMKIDDD